MKLHKARIRNYRSIRDTGWFDVESDKTILVGPNEAGKTALLQALQQINPPKGVKKLDPLRDYPRALYNDITTGKVRASNITVAEVEFALDEREKELISEDFHNCTYTYGRRLDNTAWHRVNGGPETPILSEIRKDLLRLENHVGKQAAKVEQSKDEEPNRAHNLPETISDLANETPIQGDVASAISKWLNDVTSLVDEENTTEENRLDRLLESVEIASRRDSVATALSKQRPIFVLYNNYFRVRPTIHLEHLAARIESKILDDEQYDYGNQCLLKLLGFTARQLSDLGYAQEPEAGDPNALQKYRDQLDQRSYQLNAASVQLTNEIRSIWQPDPNKAEAEKLRVLADGQYLKVVIEDDLGVEVELDQRSEGLQWLVSFFVVFFAEAAGEHKNAILLLDEPGLSLHGLKQREFRTTISRLAETNQTIYTTHSPFLVGPEELDLVRVVEMTDRSNGTKVHTTVTASDPAALLPLQEALGYDLAQSLFAQQRNLVLEGLTDYWYLTAIAELLIADNKIELNPKIALVPASGAGKVVYFATILHAQSLKVAALLDSDAAGDAAAQQEELVQTLGNKRILRTKDSYQGVVKKTEIEDLLRDTLVEIARVDLGWDVSDTSSKQQSRPIVSIFNDEIKEFSKYKLAKSFINWTRNHTVEDLTVIEREQFSMLIEKINRTLK